MYSLPYFNETEKDVVLEFMQQHAFITLVGCGEDNKVVATHVPVLQEIKEGKIFLYGHVMKDTDHFKAFNRNPEVLAIFSGPHSYVSASWYSDTRQASTWNYMVVHAKGELRFLDQQGLYNILQRTTALYEKNDSPSLVEKLPADYVGNLIKAIVGFEIEVMHLENVFKLSQNRDEKSYYSIIEKLNQNGESGKQIADEMQKRTAQLFGKKQNHNKRP